MSKPLNCKKDYDEEWVEGYFSKECPRHNLDKYGLVLEAWQNYVNHGVYLNKGGLLEQSGKCIEAFRLINGEINEWQSKKNK